ncbi:hypothetical protein JCGZ_24648 [Jatropha curcas]|uniref:Uncharacterized protein n=1 Tax=Jatropha curcas TaxID=180498 RepID=A0A067L977_JATCU|nr:GDSL esterase/lipase [Jatropha curcas]KDP40649.1 hypothetical protein JCGZ_24648 [Jatropha curcas]
MAISVCRLLCVLSLFFSVTLLNLLGCSAQYFFIFGDSLWDPGNNQYITPGEKIPSYYPPYGTTFFNHSTGRFSDGRVVPDFIAIKLKLPFIPPVLEPNADLTNGASFASGGAGVFDSNPNAMNLENQIGNFTAVAKMWNETLGEAEANKRLKEAVYMVAMGGNDYFSFTFQNPNATFLELKQYVNEVVGNITIQVKEIYNIGARKFMFQNVAPIGCLPMFKQQFNISGDGCAQLPLTLSVLHNEALTEMANTLANEYPDFTYSIFDYFTAIGQRISNPKDFGFEVGKIACCGDGSHRASNCGSFPYCVCSNASNYVFFDGGHNSEAANNQMAELMWSGGPDVVYPYNMKQLFDFDSTVKTFSKKYSLLKMRLA